MYQKFVLAKEQYASKEITLEELKILQSTLDISFENHGISRTQKDCLLCSIFFMPLLKLEKRLQQPFEHENIFIEMMEQVLDGENYECKREEGMISFETKDGSVDVVATVGEHGMVWVDTDDREIMSHFDVLLRVQHL